VWGGGGEVGEGFGWGGGCGGGGWWGGDRRGGGGGGGGAEKKLKYQHHIMSLTTCSQAGRSNTETYNDRRKTKKFNQ